MGTTVAIFLLAVLGGLLFAFLELMIAASFPFYGFLTFAIVWSLLLLPFLIWRRSLTNCVVYVAFLVVLTRLYLTPWNSRKAFLWDFRRIQIGMTVEEVEAVMGSYIRGTGWPPHPSKDEGELVALGSPSRYKYTCRGDEIVLVDCLVFRHDDHGLFDSDWGVVRVKDGRVVGTEFMPD